MLRLLVPDVHDSAAMQPPSILENPEEFVSTAGIDLAGVPVNPFSASLLPGKPSCSLLNGTLPETVKKRNCDFHMCVSPC